MLPRILVADFKSAIRFFVRSTIKKILNEENSPTTPRDVNWLDRDTGLWLRSSVRRVENEHVLLHFAGAPAVSFIRHEYNYNSVNVSISSVVKACTTSVAGTTSEVRA